MFEEKGVVIAEILPTEKNKQEEEIIETATEHAIISGAEDVKISENEFLEFTCAKTSLKKVQDALENECKYVIRSASVEFIPLKLATLTDEELEMCGKLYEKLEALPEIVKISDNIA